MFSARPIVVCVYTLNTQVCSGKDNTFGLYVMKGAEWKDGHWRHSGRLYVYYREKLWVCDIWGLRFRVLKQ